MQHVKPMFGYAVVRKQDQEKSAGGIDLSAASTADTDRWFVVECSEGHMQEGHFVACMLKPGDEVMPAPTVQRMTNPRNGETHERQIISTLQPPHFARDMHLMKLGAIAGYTPKDEVKSVVGDSPIEVVPASTLELVKGRVH